MSRAPGERFEGIAADAGTFEFTQDPDAFSGDFRAYVVPRNKRDAIFIHRTHGLRANDAKTYKSGVSFFEQLFREQSAPYGESPDPFLEAHAGPGGGARALDAGGGTGRNGIWLARNGYAVDLIDASPSAVQRANETAAAEDVPLAARVADLRGWRPEPEVYDLVVCAITLHAFKSHRAAAVAAALRDGVAPGGRFFVSLHLAGGAEQQQREREGQTQIEPGTYFYAGHHKRLFSLEEAHELLGWPTEFEGVSSGERCPRADCPFTHDVFRGLARRL